ncbi:MAG: DUF4129 domain-containing protein [Ardenticatenaceae bacterium]|nr:DUF4129 domain-containing protein [Ardenticatenaceae bacterium]
MSHSSAATSLAPNQKWILAWAYTRRELVYVTWALMEVTLLTPLALAILPWTDEWWGRSRLFFGLLVLMLAGFYLARFLSWLQLPAGDQRNILVGVGAVILFLAVRNINYDPQGPFDFSWIGESLSNLALAGSNLWLKDLFLLMLTAVAWWRGLTLLNRSIDVIHMGRRFRIGGLYIAPVIVLLAAFRLDWSVLPFLLFFFIIALTAMVLTRAESIEKEQMALLASLSPRWFGLVVMLSMVTTFLGSATAVLVSGQPGDALGRLLAPLWHALRWGGATAGLTASYFLNPVLELLDVVFHFIIGVFQAGFAILFVPNPDAPPPSDGSNDLMQAFNDWLMTQEQGGPGLFSGVNWRLVILGVVLLVALIILVQFYRKNLTTQGNGRFGKILADVTDRLIPNRLQRNRTKNKKEDWRNWRAAVSIIKIYQQMIHLSSDVGYPRANSETPFEYLKTLVKIWPDHKAEVQLITRAYVRVRYGEFPETKQEFEAIKQAWQRVQETAVSVPSKN